jgi:hypothetical protein
MHKQGFAHLLLLLVIGVALVGGYFAYQKGYITLHPNSNSNSSDFSPTFSSTNNDQVDTPTIVLTDETKDWKTYNVKIIGLQFKLPPSFNKYGELKEEIIPTSSDLAKGSVLCMTFAKRTSLLIHEVYAGGTACNIYYFGIGTTSIDFEEGRGGIFQDFQGFVKENGKYYAKTASSRNTEIPSDVAKEFKNDFGVSILKVTGKEYEGPVPLVYPGTIGALVNTKNSTYTGVAVLLDLKEGFTEKDFDKILSTFKFTN